MGPFQTIVFARAITSLKLLRVTGPISRAIKSAGIVSTETVWVSASALKSSATTMSDGRWIITPLSSAFFSIKDAVSSKSSSIMEFPVSTPLHLRKVLAMAPPIMISSTQFIIFSSAPSLLDTLAPPTMARRGLSGSAMALLKKSSSLSRRKPATDTGAYSVIAATEAWALWDTAKALFTYTSHNRASSSANTLPFSCSSLWNLKFSRSRISPSFMTDACFTAPSPTQSSARVTSLLRWVRKYSATGFRENSSTTLPLGLPICDASITLAPFSSK